MSAALRVIRVLSDGRAGHENQSVGLAAALARRTGARVETRRITGGGYFARYRRAMSGESATARPNLVIGVGHPTHLPVAYVSWRCRAKSVVIMDPTWPRRWFDLCLIPAHDFTRANAADNVVLTRGALNRIPEELPGKQPRGVVLIGGPSRHHDWDGPALATAVRAVVAARPDLDWTVGDSRRTPADFLPSLAKANLAATFAPHQQTTPDWVPAQLLAAEEAWVTEDSISMIHEAVTAGARTGILPAPARLPDARVLNAVRGLVAEGYATPFAAWQRDGQKLAPPRRLHETARCADLVLERLFPP